MVQLTAAHWVYMAGIVAVIVTMAMRRDPPVVCLVASLVLGWVVTGNPLQAVQAVFNSIQVAGTELLGIVVVISMIVAMAKMLEETGIAATIFRPLGKLMYSPSVAFWVMGVAILLAAWLIWPSPAIALVGTLLLPAAIKAGLPPMGAAMAISMFGYGCALSTDFIIQGAPNISSKAASLGVVDVISRSLTLMLVWAAIALPLSFLSIRKEIKANGSKPVEWEPLLATAEHRAEAEKWGKAAPAFKRLVIPVIGLLFLADLVCMLVFKIRGGDATALLGGTVALIMVLVAVGVYGSEGMGKLTDHTRAGFMFGIKVFAPVFVIAAFFFMGGPGTAKGIFGEGAKPLLFDLGQALANAVPLSRVPVAIVQAAVGGVTGLDGSGFSGLPLVGTLARALGGPTNLDLPTLTALGQFFAVVVGGGTIIPWAVIPAAGITGTDPIELARRNLVPTLAGMVGVVVVAIVML